MMQYPGGIKLGMNRMKLPGEAPTNGVIDD
jgi:hypothetical protein